MNVNVACPPRARARERVIALHCSGAGASQWCRLAETLGTGYEVLAPEHYGSESRGAWTGEHAFSLADEAARTLALIEKSAEKVHLIGHSYGGGLALHVALARPGKIASLALYEPTAFHLLRQLGESGDAAYAEIARVAGHVCQGVVTGDYHGAMRAFVDYWNGSSAFDAMDEHVQNSLIRWATKCPLDFYALIEEPTARSAYCALKVPALILRGEHAPTPTRMIAEELSGLLPAGRLRVIAGAGHMGPFTHASEVCRLMVQHISANEDGKRFRHWRPRGETNFLGATLQPAKAGS
jgi:pimeloyl-ACP methyl ester carboxylesterase